MRTMSGLRPPHFAEYLTLVYQKHWQVWSNLYRSDQLMLIIIIINFPDSIAVQLFACDDSGTIDQPANIVVGVRSLLAFSACVLCLCSLLAFSACVLCL